MALSRCPTWGWLQFLVAAVLCNIPKLGLVLLKSLTYSNLKYGNQQYREHLHDIKKIENSRHVGLQDGSSCSNLGECKQTFRMLSVYVKLGKILPFCKLKELKLTLYCQVYKAVLQDGSGSLVYGCVQF